MMNFSVTLLLFFLLVSLFTKLWLYWLFTKLWLYWLFTKLWLNSISLTCLVVAGSSKGCVFGRKTTWLQNVTEFAKDYCSLFPEADKSWAHGWSQQRVSIAWRYSTEQIWRHSYLQAVCTCRLSYPSPKEIFAGGACSITVVVLRNLYSNPSSNHR